jgi:hypothetical protein
MQPEWGTRIGWTDLPEHVRAGVEQILGAPVKEAVGQQGGFSPGTADRILTTTGQRAFVKAVSPAQNEHSPAIHRKEAAITGALPPAVPSPSLIGTFDDGNWVVLILADVDGRHPSVPWSAEELALVLDALLLLAQTPVPQTLQHLPALQAELTEASGGWHRLKSDPPPLCDPWILANLEFLDRVAKRGLKDVRGDSLVHTDVRADNILITHDDTAVFVDWPWASVGAGWVDALTVLVNVRVFDPAFDVEAVLAAHPVFAAAQPASINHVLSGLGAYFIDAARLPAPAGLPTLRSFQQQQGDAVMAWLRQRLSP